MHVRHRPCLGFMAVTATITSNDVDGYTIRKTEHHLNMIGSLAIRIVFWGMVWYSIV